MVPILYAGFSYAKREVQALKMVYFKYLDINYSRL